MKTSKEKTVFTLKQDPPVNDDKKNASEVKPDELVQKEKRFQR